MPNITSVFLVVQVLLGSSFLAGLYFSTLDLSIKVMILSISIFIWFKSVLDEIAHGDRHELSVKLAILQLQSQENFSLQPVEDRRSLSNILETFNSEIKFEDAMKNSAEMFLGLFLMFTLPYIAVTSLIIYLVQQAISAK